MKCSWVCAKGAASAHEHSGVFSIYLVDPHHSSIDQALLRKSLSEEPRSQARS